MTKRNIQLSLLALLWVLVSPDGLLANSFGVNLYGLSYHANDRDRVNSIRDRGGTFNETNYGIGARATWDTDSSVVTFIVEGGTFKDTFENQAKYLASGLQLRLFLQFRVGALAAIYSTKSIARGEAFFAVVPLASYRVSIVTLNSVYLPKYEGRNPYHTFGLYLTISLFEGQPKKRDKK